MNKPLPKSEPMFCIITPTAYVNDYASQSNRHLVLAHIVDTNEEYASRYHRLSLRGDYIIMDNGAFELGESYPPEKLIELGLKCGADAIVLPDYPFQPFSVTIRAAEQWIAKIKEAGFKTFFVPQSETGDKEGWIRGYEWGVGNPDVDIVGMSILGIPNALPHIPAAYARVVMTEILQDRKIFNADKYHHYLGLNAGPALEIPPLLKMKALDSVDSSNPVWMAILGHEYTLSADSYLSVKKVKKEVDFDFPFIADMETHRRIQRNVSLTLQLLENTHG